MRRVNLFLIITVVSLVSLVAVLAAGYVVFSSPSYASGNPGYNWMNQMMGGGAGGYGMMGGYGAQTPAQANAFPWLGVAFVALIAAVVVGVGGFVYFFAFPEIRTRSQAVSLVAPTNVPVASSAVVSAKVGETPAETPYESVNKTLTADERRVLDVLRSHGGKYLQKYIRSETGLSRLQTHRIVARLAERGIVLLEKTGNTNTVALANWLN